MEQPDWHGPLTEAYQHATRFLTGLPDRPVGSRATTALPPTLLHAVDALEADPVVTGVLNCAGEGVATYFANLKREEFFTYHGTVTPWEVDTYLTAF